MGRTSKRPPLVLGREARAKLVGLSESQTEQARRVERARILLAYAAGRSISVIARDVGTNPPKVARCVDRALQFGAIASLDDVKGRGRRPDLTPEARAWVVALACQKPKELGYSYELWTNRLLAAHVRKHCESAGHPSLKRLARGTVSKILTKSGVRPHKITYYLERRDPEFDAKMAQVLYVYKQVELARSGAKTDPTLAAVLSYDEKPGIQAIENMAPDLPPVPGKHPSVARDHQYVRHGTVSLMAGIDLLSGRVHGLIVDRHRSAEFVQFLKQVDQYYPTDTRIRVVLDNHSAHISRETQRYLATVPNRFEFTFTPKHGSWLNLIESFFGKMARTMLRGIRVSSKAELKERINLFFQEINETPVIFRWKYGLDSVSVA